MSQLNEQMAKQMADAIKKNILQNSKQVFQSVPNDKELEGVIIASNTDATHTVVIQKATYTKIPQERSLGTLDVGTKVKVKVPNNQMSQAYICGVVDGTVSSGGGGGGGADKANLDASNLSSANVSSWRTKLNVPSKTSDLTNDSGFIDKNVNDLVNYPLSSSLATVATSGNYNDLSNKPTIPDVSDRAKTDASNLTINNVIAWRTKLNTPTISLSGNVLTIVF